MGTLDNREIKWKEIRKDVYLSSVCSIWARCLEVNTKDNGKLTKNYSAGGLYEIQVQINERTCQSKW